MSDSNASAFNDFNRNIIEEFRNNNGKVTGMFADAPLLLLTSTGAKSGRSHTTPVVYTRDGDNYVIIASKGGAPTNPAWYYNLRANPEATIELPGQTVKVRAQIPEGDERTRLFDNMAAKMPNFAEYQKNTTRQIPVVVLAPA